jgi:nitrogenase molybdenum-iron protein alpha/beta subunit
MKDMIWRKYKTKTMTSKEKAEELILKFMRLQEPNYNWFHSKLAKQCALIAVDEVLKYSKSHGFIGLTEEYQQVKQEIEKL